MTTAIKTGTYKSQAAGWLTGMKITDAQASSLLWAQDTNAFVCSTVMPKGEAAVENVDLGGAYYTAAVPIVQLQIAKAGYRYVSSVSVTL